jgi:hypothetical protein
MQSVLLLMCSPTLFSSTSYLGSRRLKNHTIRLLLSPTSSHERLLSIGLGERVLKGLDLLEKSTPVDKKATKTLLC